MEESSIAYFLGLLYAPNNVKHMLCGKAYYKARLLGIFAVVISALYDVELLHFKYELPVEQKAMASASETAKIALGTDKNCYFSLDSVTAQPQSSILGTV